MFRALIYRKIKEGAARCGLSGRLTRGSDSWCHWQNDIRLMSSMPSIHDCGYEIAADTKFGEFIKMPGSTMLVRLHERGWGALATLPCTKVKEAGYGGAVMPSRIAVVRDAFAAHDENPRMLKDAIVPIGAHTVAVSSEVTKTNERLVVDLYDLHPGGDSYHLQTIGTDLLRYLKGNGLRVRQVPDLAQAVKNLKDSLTHKQSTNEVLMVAPTAFVYNDQAAQDNSFMNTETGEILKTSVTQQVLKEFADLYTVLTEDARVKVNLFQHSLEHGTPDAVFPNNWFSTHAASESDGNVGQSTLVYYPMKCPNRQAERRDDIKCVLEQMGFQRIIDMSAEEKNDKYFEGTGVLVLDRARGVAYVALSERADKGLAEDWVSSMGYRDLVTFHSSDGAGSPVYHTNVMMAIGTSVAVACLESIADDKERKHFVEKLSKTHEIVDISRHQMSALCGNVLELEDDRGLPVMAMSTRAYNAFSLDQKNTLRRHVAALHHANIDTLEHIGGGGVRCTLAELMV
eukprot:jgi/Picsp_1/6398/NSC_03746-R1_amidinotransferase family protein